ncbi:MAG TPA: hypothetical protein ENH91_14505 [Leeuwenhoekiella sp.]|nr:hypothetical protein [Leeuwenhoekiella sp.]
MRKFNILFLLVLAITLTSCSIRLVDFTTISSKNVSLDIDKTKGIQVEASKSYFLSIGWNIKDALDEALESAGPEYDLLVDGVVRYSSYPFISSVKVEGTAVNSRDIKMVYGQEGYEQWLNDNDIFDPETATVEVVDN